MTKYDPGLSRLFHALADDTRRATLARLAKAPQRVSDLAQPTGLSLPTVMRHLDVLEQAGLITSTKDGRTRTCMLVPDALDEAHAWLTQQREIWDARLGRLEAFVLQSEKETGQ